MNRMKLVVGGFAVAALFAMGSAMPAAAADSAKMDFYGFVMMDAGYNNQAIDPAWFDAQRPTKLPGIATCPMT